jgi:Tfp pilus assembly protein PilN
MIDINLVPPALRKKSSGVLSGLNVNIAPEVLLGVGGGCVALLIAAHILLFAAWGVQAMILAGQKAEWQKVLPDKKNIDALATELRDLKKRLTSITEVTSSKSMDWSRKLNTISDSLTKGLWLRNVVLDKNALTIEGSVISRNQSEVMTVGNFVDSLKKEEAFMRDFAGLEVNSIQRSKKGNTDVANFVITAKFK